MKLHPITWILLGVAGVQLAALSIDLAAIVQAVGEARRQMPGGAGEADVLNASLGQSLGQTLQRLGGIVVSAALAAWVEILSRIYHRLRIQNAQG